MRRYAAECLAEKQRREEAAKKRQEDLQNLRRQQRRSTFFDPAERNDPQTHTHTATCRHDGWWSKIEGRTTCPECHDAWKYLLQCPGCSMQACPRCQAAVRPRRPRNSEFSEDGSKNTSTGQDTKPGFWLWILAVVSWESLDAIFFCIEFVVDAGNGGTLAHSATVCREPCSWSHNHATVYPRTIYRLGKVLPLPLGKSRRHIRQK
jgi:hypothetical protein